MKAPPLRKVVQRFILIPNSTGGHDDFLIDGIREVIYRERLACGHDLDKPAMAADDAYQQRQCNKCFAVYETLVRKAIDDAATRLE